jgi:hypothetical protein
MENNVQLSLDFQSVTMASRVISKDHSSVIARDWKLARGPEPRSNVVLLSSSRMSHMTAGPAAAQESRKDLISKILNSVRLFE